MKYTVSIIREIEADDEKLAALEGYKQIMRAGTDVETVTLSVSYATGNAKDVTLSVQEADDYAGFTPPGFFMA